ncbi:MAG: glycosyltransferase family 4 protein [Anaerolineae bacterium]|nr:glycosyltransferase family 4 protein [Anaerolineae bacterium]
MRIVMIGPFGLHSRGTMGVRALPMAQALVRRDHEVIMLLPPWRTPDESGQCWEDGGVLVRNINLPPKVPGIFHLWTAARLLSGALSYRPDVLYVFKPKAYSGLAHWLAMLLPRKRRPRIVLDTDDWEGTGGWNEFGDYSPIQRWVFAWQERWGTRHADAVTVASRTLESLTWAMGVDPGSVFYIPNGVEPDAPVQERVSREQRAPVILLYTRFFEFSIARVLDVLASVRDRVPTARMLVVGKGFHGEEGALLDLARSRGMADAIEYAGWVQTAALPLRLAQADVAIYPFDDTLINRTKCAVKLRDLLVAGIPVVAEAVGQNREYIRHGVTGLLVEPGDVDAFSDAVVRFLSDSSLRRKVSDAAARDIRHRFSWDRLAETVERACLE